MPPIVTAAVLLIIFALVSTVARRLVLARCDTDTREELADQAKNLLTGVAATFAFFVGFAISLSWGAVNAAQTAVEQQSAAVQTMAWELRNIPDKATSAALLGKLRTYASTAADADAHFLARGQGNGLPSATALNDFEDSLNAYAYGPAGATRAAALVSAGSTLISSSAAVSAVANRALPQPLAALLMIVALLVTIVMGISTVNGGRSTMVFVYIWCLIPALSIAVVLALAYPFALRSGMTLAPIRAVAQSLAG